MNPTTTQIAFSTTRTGQRVAYRWSIRAGRWFRLGMERARLMVATGAARIVTHNAPATIAAAPVVLVHYASAGVMACGVNYGRNVRFTVEPADVTCPKCQCVMVRAHSAGAFQSDRSAK